jgi:hypothetical protein
MTIVFANVHEKGKNYEGFIFPEKTQLLACYTHGETLHYLKMCMRYEREIGSHLFLNDFGG